MSPFLVRFAYGNRVQLSVFYQLFNFLF